MVKRVKAWTRESRRRCVGVEWRRFKARPDREGEGGRRTPRCHTNRGRVTAPCGLQSEDHMDILSHMFHSFVLSPQAFKTNEVSTRGHDG